MARVPDFQPGDKVQTLVAVPGICKAKEIGFIDRYEGGDHADVRFKSPPGSDKLPYFATIAIEHLRRV